ncbi:MAG: glycoside hydrolase family 3 N-terminal domain-containing protein, partial [Solirubrobacteraceae bacterium]
MAAPGPGRARRRPAPPPRWLLAGLLGAAAVAVAGVLVAHERRRATVAPGAPRALAALRITAAGGAPVATGPASAHRAAATVPVQRLSLDQLAGQRIIYAYAGLQPPASLLTAIRAGEAAGVIFFAPNIQSPGQIRTVIARLQSAEASSAIHAPLLMLTDQEGGEVRRLPGAPVLSEQEIGASPNGAALAAQAGTGAGQTLAGAGLNVNLAPVLDVFRAPGNFIDEFQRSYSRNPATVARLGEAFITAQQRTGVAATAKHFPGLGAAARSQDTDAGPVTLNVGLAQLRTDDEAPYRSAIAAGVKLVMLSWAVYPALDPRLPAGLSPDVIGGELRGRLGFRGVTITDAITAGALTGFGGLGRRGVLAAQGGADLILCSTIDPAQDSPAQGLSVLQALASALSAGELSRAAAQEAAARVIALRSHP